MPKKIHLLITTCVLLLTGCTKLMFDKVMPQDAQRIQDIPRSITGNYVTIIYAQDGIIGEFRRIERIADTTLNIYKQRVKYIDSSAMINISLSTIDTAWYSNKEIHFKGENKIYSRDYLDTLESEAEKLEYSFNLSSSYYSENEEQPVPFEIRSKNGSFYINTHYKRNYQFITKIEIIGQNLHITSHYLQTEDSAKFANVSKQYRFIDVHEEIYKDGPMFNEQREYLASVNDAEFIELMNQKGVFTQHVWYKIEREDNFSWLFILIGLSMGLILIFFVRKKINRKT